MFFFDVKGCFLLIGLDDVDFSGVVGNFGQIFTFYFSIVNDLNELSKKDFSLSSLAESKLQFQEFECWREALLPYQTRYYYHCW